MNMSWAIVISGILTTLIVVFVLVRIWSEKGSKKITGDWSSDSDS
ncbi:hypothetical protein [Candidatus Nitronereus thalassa]|uniref:Uncharacterized protein n=1 Tax=Candidatus Nitronereus thalassa TaxID=3020898 RepID=A0ABU3K9B1_9BACT|nr:hypothetical protein [Candidatus Nitronereus thalassa]MDT7043034.1 hypothetical protein [Candidatus Nitronereus thalassa]